MHVEATLYSASDIQLDSLTASRSYSLCPLLESATKYLGAQQGRGLAENCKLRKCSTRQNRINSKPQLEGARRGWGGGECKCMQLQIETMSERATPSGKTLRHAPCPPARQRHSKPRQAREVRSLVH